MARPEMAGDPKPSRCVGSSKSSPARWLTSRRMTRTSRSRSRSAPTPADPTCQSPKASIVACHQSRRRAPKPQPVRRSASPRRLVAESVRNPLRARTNASSPPTHPLHTWPAPRGGALGRTDGRVESTPARGSPRRCGGTQQAPTRALRHLRATTVGRRVAIPVTSSPAPQGTLEAFASSGPQGLLFRSFGAVEVATLMPCQPF
jgi:hypothetical protein